jgi:hypothetical protein
MITATTYDYDDDDGGDNSDLDDGEAKILQ